MSSSRRQYPFHLIEPKWQKIWDDQQAFRAFNPGDEIPAAHPFALRHKISGKVSAAQLPPKFYILDMFPYPSGAGLHVGHPEGYTATDILARYKRAQGFNVLHPMGWDAFGLPAEQYAVKTGQHPRKTTEENIATFKRQIKSLGFSYDWSREIATTDPDYFKWTQWIFLKLYNSYFDPELNKAQPIESLEDALSDNPKRKNEWKDNLYLAGTHDAWKKFTPEQRNVRDRMIINSRLAFVSEAPVWWCQELGTVLANEEVVDGKSEVGGFPVVRKPMRQWMLRITKYAERLIQDLDTIDWTDSLKEMQRNWIGRSEGAEVDFQIAGSSEKIRVFTTRPDTLFGATYMVLSPEHKLLKKIIPEAWPKETPPHWRGQFYWDKERTEVVKTGKDNSIGIGLSAPISTLTREQAAQKAEELGLETFSLENWKPEKELVEAVPRHFIRQYRVIPLEISPDRVTLATDAPANLTSFDALGFALGKEVRLKVTSTEDLEAAYQKIPAPSLEGIFTELTQVYYDPPRQAVEKYQASAAAKSDLERTELAKDKTGVFTGAYAVNPVNGEKIPIWIADYVLASYGTGAIMAVPAHDERDFAFAKRFKLPIKAVVQPPLEWFSDKIYEKEPGYPPLSPDKQQESLKSSQSLYARDPGMIPVAFCGEGVAINSPLFDNLPTAEAKKKITDWLQEKGLGKRTINYKLRDWLFSRQRYWGEPFPIIWKTGQVKGTAYPYHEALPEAALPVLPPELTDYKPTATGEPPLARAKDWVNMPDGSQRETNTMPQWAGSCWYYLRYLDAKNNSAFVGKGVENYWMSGKSAGVDLYVGGTEHAVLHLLYARFWHKVLYDLGLVSTAEPFFKLVNQGMVLGETEFNAFHEQDGTWVSAEKLIIHAGGASAWGTYKDSDKSVLGKRLSENEVVQKGGDYFLASNPAIKVDARSFKMSKSRGNVIPVDVPVRENGTDALRLYEMFMGPLEMVKPWSTKGVKGVYSFLGRVWRLFVDEKSETEFEQAETTTAPEKQGELLSLIRLDPAIKDVAATPAQLKTLHAAIKKVTEDLDGLRFNTAISALMVFVNEAMTWETKPVSALRDFLILLHPFAPHLAEELWAKLSTLNPQLSTNLAYSVWPKFDPALLIESEMEIPVQVNGKLRDVIKVPVNISQADLETAAKNSEKAKPFIDGKTIKKIIVVPKKLVNLIVS